MMSPTPGGAPMDEQAAERRALADMERNVRDIPTHEAWVAVKVIAALRALLDDRARLTARVAELEGLIHAWRRMPMHRRMYGLDLLAAIGEEDTDPAADVFKDR